MKGCGNASASQHVIFALGPPLPCTSERLCAARTVGTTLDVRPAVHRAWDKRPAGRMPWRHLAHANGSAAHESLLPGLGDRE
jgi:hypothetical protein